MIEFDVHPLAAQLVKAVQIASRSKARKCEEVADQMRLVKIAVVQSQLCPIGLRNSVHEMQDALKSVDAVENLRLQTHLKPEYIDKPAVTEARRAGQFANYRARVIEAKTFQR